MEDANNNRLGWLDYLVFSLTLVAALGIGVYHSLVGGGQKTTNQYLLANRHLGVIPATLSIFMTTVSGLVILGLSAEMYMYGTQMWLDLVASSIMRIIGVYIYLPMMYSLKLTTSFEYHMLRYKSVILHKVCVILSIMTGLIYCGLVMYAPSTSLEAVAGFPVWASLLCVGLVAVIYTTIGGLKTVVWTDVFQGIVLFSGLLVVLIVGCLKVGGLSAVWDISNRGGRINFINMDPDQTERATFWSIMLGPVFVIGSVISEQSTLMRYTAMATMKQAVTVVLLQIPLNVIANTLICLCGLTAFAYYEQEGCDPYRSKAISSSNQIIPYFLVNAVNINGITGIFIAVLYSGALSSISSVLNALATITWKDILEKYFMRFNEYKRATVTKVTVLIYGLIGIAVGFAMKYFQGNIMQLTTTLLLGLAAPLPVVILVGSLLPWIQAKGMITGLLAGVGIYLWMSIGQLMNYPHRTYLNTTVENCTFDVNETAREIPSDPEGVFWVYNLSFKYIPLATFLTTFIVAIVASFITGKQDPKSLDPKLMVNLGDKCGCCCSSSCEDKCTCGVPYYNYKNDTKYGDCGKENQYDKGCEKIKENQIYDTLGKNDIAKGNKDGQIKSYLETDAAGNISTKL